MYLPSMIDWTARMLVGSVYTTKEEFHGCTRLNLYRRPNEFLFDITFDYSGEIVVKTASGEVLVKTDSYTTLFSYIKHNDLMSDAFTVDQVQPTIGMNIQGEAK